MSAYARVSRDAMYGETTNGTLDTEITARQKPRRKQRARKWKTVGVDHLSELETATRDSTIGDNKNNKVNGEVPRAAAPSLLPLPQASTTPSSNSLSSSIPPPQTSDEVKQPPQSKAPRKKRQRGRKRTSKMPAQLEGKFTPPLKLEGKFIPPHLRKKTVDTLQNDSPSTPKGQHVTAEVSTASTRPFTAATAPKRPKSPLSPPTSAEPLQHSGGAKPVKSMPSTVEEKPIVWGEWNEPTADIPNEPADNSRGKSNGLGQSKWNNNRQINWLKGPRRNPNRTVWAKNRDMRAPPTDDESEGGCDLKSHSDGDPDYDIKKLIDWEGNWLPAGDWAGRKHFADRHFGDRIEEWARSIPPAVEASEIIVNEIPDFCSDNNSALAPIWWIPGKIEGETPRIFWGTFASRAPAPVDEGDVSGGPWWETYVDKENHLLGPLEVPDARVDPEDTFNALPGARVNSNEVVARKLRAEKARRDKIMAKRNRPIQDSAGVRPDADQLPLVPPLAPAIYLYLRPVRATDVDQINAIYNHYVAHTVLANEFTNRKHAQMLDRINDIVERGLPWIVAVAKAGRTPGKYGGYVAENIVGFANIDDFCDQGSMYRYTFEMEMYVHPECLGKGVGSCIMDKLLSMVATGYDQRGGYEWRPAENYLKFGSSRVTKVVNVTYPHETYEGKARPDELQKFFRFMDRYGFKHNARLRKVGFKYGKVVDVSIYQYETTETIDADQRPTIPL